MTTRKHPRSRIVAEASNELSNAICDIIDKHDLTHAELLWLLTDAAQHWASRAISDEREDDK